MASNQGNAGAFRPTFNGAAHSEDSRGTASLSETDLAANRKAFALRFSDTDMWTTAAPLLPTRNSEQPVVRLHILWLNRSAMNCITT